MTLENYIDPRDLMFWLYQHCDADALAHKPAFASFQREDVEAMLDAVSELAEGTMSGLADLMDAHPPQFDNGEVIHKQELKQALAAYLESGFPAARFSPELGGMDMPYLIS